MDIKTLPNNHGGPWANMDDYVDTHFRLLREDYIEPLREVLLQYIRRQGIQRFVVYQLQISGPTPSPLTFKARLRILNRRDPRRVFAHGTRLKYGSLIALLLFDVDRRGIEEMVFGTIASYKFEDAMK